MTLPSYISGERIQGRSDDSELTATPQTSWKELDRVTLGSSADEMDTGTFAVKDNLMLLIHVIPESGTVSTGVRFNDVDDAEYSYRRSDNGGSDGTEGGLNYDALQNASSPNDIFIVTNIRNTLNREKLWTIDLMNRGTAGSGNQVNRREGVGKWDNTAQINRVKVYNTDSGSYAAGSEIVVLGCDDDEADSGTNFWQELYTSNATGDYDTGVGGIAAKRYLMMDMILESGGDTGLIFNGDSGGNYAHRQAHNGAADYAGYLNQSGAWLNSGQTMTSGEFGMYKVYIVNVSAREKLIISHAVINEVSGVNEPERAEVNSKWVNTSAQITDIEGASGGGTLVNHNVRIWGGN